MHSFSISECFPHPGELFLEQEPLLASSLLQSYYLHIRFCIVYFCISCVSVF